jgi:hypothetical protein
LFVISEQIDNNKKGSTPSDPNCAFHISDEYATAPMVFGSKLEGSNKQQRHHHQPSGPSTLLATAILLPFVMVLGIVPAFQLSAFAQQSETEQTTDQIGSQVAEAHAGDEDEIRQVLEQLADQIAENTSSSIANQAITQLGSQVAASREGQVSQSIFQFVQQQAIADEEGDDSDDVEKTIAQIAEQVAEGDDISQAVVQVVERNATTTGTEDDETTN